MKIIPRSEWTATIPKSTVGAEDVTGTPWLRQQEVTGISLLTPNESILFVEISPVSYLETLRKADFSTRGYGDISYNLAVAPNVKGIFCLRGLCNKSAAHKDKGNNSTNVSVLTLLGREEPPTDLLLQNLITCRDFIVSKFPNATEGLTTLPFSDFWDMKVPAESKQFSCTLPNTSLKEGDSGVQVFDLVENLAYWNYYKARNDGVYGPVCRNAVAELQADLSPKYYMKRIDGEYGRYTREAFCLYLKQLST